MRKILLILVFYLSAICFSTDGFKDLKWGSSPKQVIMKMGEARSIDLKNGENGLIYEDVDFFNLNLETLLFAFENNKLVSWMGEADCTSIEIIKILDEFEKKYGKLKAGESSDGLPVYHYFGHFNSVSFKISYSQNIDKKLRLHILYSKNRILKKID